MLGSNIVFNSIRFELSRENECFPGVDRYLSTGSQPQNQWLASWTPVSGLVRCWVIFVSPSVMKPLTRVAIGNRVCDGLTLTENNNKKSILVWIINMLSKFRRVVSDCVRIEFRCQLLNSENFKDQQWPYRIERCDKGESDGRIC